MPAKSLLQLGAVRVGLAGPVLEAPWAGPWLQAGKPMGLPFPGMPCSTFHYPHISPTGLPRLTLPGLCRPRKQRGEASGHPCANLPTAWVITNTLHITFATLLGRHGRLMPSQAQPRIKKLHGGENCPGSGKDRRPKKICYKSPGRTQGRWWKAQVHST